MSPVRATWAQPTVVVLAAGASVRFGGAHSKLSQRLGALEVLAHTLQAVIKSGLPLVVVTTAPLVEVARRIVASRDIVLLPPVGSLSREPLGVGYSIAAGVSARAQAPGWLILPGDMPLVQPTSLSAVARALSQSPVAYAQYRGRQGWPIGLSSELYSDLARLSGEEGLRRMLASYPSTPLEVPDPGVLIDINTPADLDKVRQSPALLAGLHGV